MICARLHFSGHAVQRMFERGISVEDVRAVLSTGEPIHTYPDDSPYPSRLLLGYVAGRPLHVVVAAEEPLPGAPDTFGTCHVIAVYVPDPSLWEDGYRVRRRP